MASLLSFFVDSLFEIAASDRYTSNGIKIRCLSKSFYDTVNSLMVFLPDDFQCHRVFIIEDIRSNTRAELTYTDEIKIFVDPANFNEHELKFAILHELRHAYQFMYREYMFDGGTAHINALSKEEYSLLPYEQDANGWALSCVGSYGLGEFFTLHVKNGKVLF